MTPVLRPRPQPSLRGWLGDHPGEIEAVVLDIDGVLIKAHRPLPGGPELIAHLRATGTPFTLLTNDGCHSPQEKTRFLRDCGFEFACDEIVSSGHGLNLLAEERDWRGTRFFAMGSLGEPCYALGAGLQVTRELADLSGCTGVVVGEKDYDWHQVIAAVFNFLVEHPAAPLIVPNPDVAYPGRHNRLHPASGAVARFLQLLCREFDHPLEPVYLGKPFAPIFRWNHRLLEHRAGRPIRHDRVLMVGDFLASDIRGGRDFGYRTALVLTGITTIELLHRSEIQPELVFMRL